jgi:hypothetical protein
MGTGNFAKITNGYQNAKICYELDMTAWWWTTVLLVKLQD